MAIPKIDEKSVTEALKYIDKNGIPDKNKSTQYVLVAEDGKQYPPKYVIAVANHIANGEDDVKINLNYGSTYEGRVIPRDDVAVIKHGLKIPFDVNDYADFVDKIVINENIFIQNIL